MTACLLHNTPANTTNYAAAFSISGKSYIDCKTKPIVLVTIVGNGNLSPRITIESIDNARGFDRFFYTYPRKVGNGKGHIFSIRVSTEKIYDLSIKMRYSSNVYLCDELNKVPSELAFDKKYHKKPSEGMKIPTQGITTLDNILAISARSSTSDSLNMDKMYPAGEDINNDDIIILDAYDSKWYKATNTNHQFSVASLTVARSTNKYNKDAKVTSTVNSIFQLPKSYSLESSKNYSIYLKCKLSSDGYYLSSGKLVIDPKMEDIEDEYSSFLRLGMIVNKSTRMIYLDTNNHLYTLNYNDNLIALDGKDIRDSLCLPILNGDNLNDDKYKSTGKYSCDSIDIQVSNSPCNGYEYLLEVIQSNEIGDDSTHKLSYNKVIQRITIIYSSHNKLEYNKDHRTHLQYVRVYNNGTWTDWRIDLSAYVDTPAKSPANIEYDTKYLGHIGINCNPDDKDNDSINSSLVKLTNSDKIHPVVLVSNNTDSSSSVVKLIGNDSASSTTGSAQIDGGVGITKNLYVGSKLNVTGSSSLHDTLDVDKATTLHDTLDTKGDTHLESKLTTDGTTQLNDTLTVVKSTKLQDTLDVTDTTHLNNDLYVGYINNSSPYTYIGKENGVPYLYFKSDSSNTYKVKGDSEGLGIYRGSNKKLNISSNGAEVTGIMLASNSVKVKGSTDYPYSSLSGSSLYFYLSNSDNYSILSSTNDISFRRNGKSKLTITDAGVKFSNVTESFTIGKNSDSSISYNTISTDQVWFMGQGNNAALTYEPSGPYTKLMLKVNGTESLSCYSSYTKINEELVVPKISSGSDSNPIDISSNIRRGTSGTRWSLSNSQLFMSYYYSDAHYDVTLGHGDADGLVVKRIDSSNTSYGDVRITDGGHGSIVIGASISDGNGPGHTTIMMDNWLDAGGTPVVVNNNYICRESSSRRYKKDINYDIDSNKIISNLEKLSPVTFRYKSSSSPYTQLGLIAEDVELVDDNLVNYSIKSDGTKQVESVKYNNITIMNTVAIQKLINDNNSLRSVIKLLADKLGLSDSIDDLLS